MQAADMLRVGAKELFAPVAWLPQGSSERDLRQARQVTQYVISGLHTMRLRMDLAFESLCDEPTENNPELVAALEEGRALIAAWRADVHWADFRLRVEEFAPEMMEEFDAEFAAALVSIERMTTLIEAKLRRARPREERFREALARTMHMHAGTLRRLAQ